MERKIKRLWRRLQRMLCGQRFGKQKFTVCCLFGIIAIIYILINIKRNRENVEDNISGEQREMSTDILEEQALEYCKGNLEESAKEAEKTEAAGTIEQAEGKAEPDFEALSGMLLKEDESLFTEAEKKQLQETVLEAAEQAADIYKNIEMEEGPSFASNIKSFTKEQCREAAAVLGKAGYTSITEGCNMQNPEAAEAFYDACQKGQDAAFTVFDVQDDGLISVKTFIHRKKQLQVYYIGIGWQTGGIPEVRDDSISTLAQVNLTEKGYFIYEYKNIIPHSGTRLYWRMKPLSDECRKLTEKYISGLSYVNYNVLVTDWDSSNVEDILMPCMFEDIYRIDTGENIRVENGMIPAELYEKIMTVYFPASAEQVRDCCGYDKDKDAYPYEMILGHQYPPFGEVVDYQENRDGTITLTVDGVWPDYDSDCAFVNTIVVKPFGDGTFRYLSNSIEERELALPEADEVRDYDLPISTEAQKEAEKDCVWMMSYVSDIYGRADQGENSDVVLSDELIFQMQDIIGKSGVPVTTAVLYSDMENYRKADSFLRECGEGWNGSLVIYKVRFDGGILRNKFIFDGKTMYVLTANAVWGAEQKPKISYFSFARIEQWRYTDNGWFGWQVCVPDYPEVTEIVDGSSLVRIKPMTKRQRELSERCVMGLGYSGNNLLCEDWDADHMERLDYNGVYEYFYVMKYQEAFPFEDYREGIPAEEFENLIMAYLPVTAARIREYAVFDEKKQVYRWNHLRGGEYVLNFFETSLPEVVKIRENEDGTVTLTVNAVCDTVICDDAVIIHELTVRFAEDGSFQYLSNCILRGKENLPAYQYRIAEMRAE